MHVRRLQSIGLLSAILFVLFVSIVPASVQAQDGEFINPLKTKNPFEIGDGNDQGTLDEKLGVAVEPFARIVKMIITMSTLFLFLMILWGGFQYLTAAGDPEKAGAGMKTVLWAVLGAAVVLGSYVIAAWLVWPLGNIFGLNKPLATTSSSSRNNGYDTDRPMCCGFTLSSGNTIYRTVESGGMDACNAIIAKARVKNVAVQVTLGKCANESKASEDLPEPTGCCILSKATWSGLRCHDNFTGPACTASASGNTWVLAESTPCSQMKDCQQYTDCCRYWNGARVAQCTTLPNDGTRDGRTQACASVQPTGTTVDYLTGDCTQHTVQCGGRIVQPSPLPQNGENKKTSASEKCCVPDTASWTYSTNRGVCFPPSLDANQNPTCGKGWTLASQSCSSFSTTCTKPQANPPSDPPGCCYWRETPGASPTCTQRISESLCKQDHDKLPKDDVWFSTWSEPLQQCTPKPGGVDCVANTTNRP